MAKIGYNFNGGRQAVKPRNHRNGGRYLFIFILLLAFCSGIYFMFIRNTSNSTAPTSSSNKQIVSQPVEKVKLTTLEAKSPVAAKKPQLSVTKSPIKAAPQQYIIPTKVTELCEKSTTAMAAKEYVQAREFALKALSQPGVEQYNAGWLKAAEALSLANSAIISSDVPLPGKKIPYKVVSGDALQKIAKKFNTTVELIQRSNNMKTNNYVVWEGQGLKIYQGNWIIKISKKHCLLALYDGNELFKIYHIGIGRQNRTPECTFTIVSKKKNPAWYKSKKEIIPFGTKENVLGTRWMSLKATDEQFKHLSGYGIHGTWNNDSIGKAMSNGCIRMKNSEVEELFAIVPYKTKVTIEK
jgi:lipoprotein-anchoring transpeptidase ErfK/SrfK